MSIITTIFDDVLLVFVLFLLSFWRPCMTINVNIQSNGGLLPDIILFTECYPIGDGKVLYLQPLIPPKRFYAQKV